MTEKQSLGENDLGLLLVLAACIIGGGIRFYTVYLAGFPINDGGLFFNMADAMHHNGYSLPKFVHYNGLQIPFAYPPLGFILANLVRDVLGIPLIEVFRWLPAAITTLTIYAVFILAGQLLESNFEAGIAAMIYALLPRSITWLIMGGGITRSLGQLFLILTVYNLYRLFSDGTRKYAWYAILTGSLVCLTHPEAALHTVALAVLVWFFKGRTTRSAFQAIAIAFGILVLTAIWWFPILNTFGVAPYLSAAQTGLHDPLFILYFFVLPFSDEPHLTFIIVFAILGLFVMLAKKQYFLPLFYSLPFIIEPRNAANVNAIPMAMLASVALNQLIFTGLHHMGEKPPDSGSAVGLQGFVPKILSMYIFLAMFISMLHFSVQLADKRVTEGNLAAFVWIKDNTPPDSKFLVLTGKTDLFGDWTTEWFPALTFRRSVTTIQGREWIDGEAFAAHTRLFQDLQACLFTPEPLPCIQDLSRGSNLEYEYIYISQKTMRSEKHTSGTELILELAASEAYDMVYETDEVAIFRSP